MALAMPEEGEEAVKLLADLLIENHDPRDKDAVFAADLMKRPSGNHGAEPQPLVERFVFDDAAFDAMFGVMADPDSRRAAFYYCHVPILPMWLESPVDGFLLTAGFGETEIRWFVKGKRPRCIVQSTLEAILGVQQAGAMVANDVARDEDLLQTAFKKTSSLPLFLAVLTSPHMASAERVMPPRLVGSAERAAARRAAQRHGPRYSYNIVRLKVPEAAIQRHHSRGGVALDPKRGHWVIGHWRLIDNKIEPYWTWVEGHKAGDESRGFVTKERHVTIRESTRKGYVLPNTAGEPGQRTPARKAS